MSESTSAERGAWRHARIIELQRELQDLMLEEEQAAQVDSRSLREECLRMKQAGRAVQAVKHYREKVGCGLREAHDVVMALR